MFYTKNLLSIKGKFGIIWLIGSEDRPEKSLKRRKIDAVDVKKNCHRIEELIPVSDVHVSISMAATLMCGIARIHSMQAKYLMKDINGFRINQRRMKELLRGIDLTAPEIDFAQLADNLEERVMVKTTPVDFTRHQVDLRMITLVEPEANLVAPEEEGFGELTSPEDVFDALPPLLFPNNDTVQAENPKPESPTAPIRPQHPSPVDDGVTLVEEGAPESRALPDPAPFDQDFSTLAQEIESPRPEIPRLPEPIECQPMEDIALEPADLEPVAKKARIQKKLRIDPIIAISISTMEKRVEEAKRNIQRPERTIKVKPSDPFSKPAKRILSAQLALDFPGCAGEIEPYVELEADGTIDDQNGNITQARNEQNVSVARMSESLNTEGSHGMPIPNENQEFFDQGPENVFDVFPNASRELSAMRPQGESVSLEVDLTSYLDSDRDECKKLLREMLSGDWTNLNEFLQRRGCARREAAQFFYSLLTLEAEGVLNTIQEVHFGPICFKTA